MNDTYIYIFMFVMLKCVSWNKFNSSWGQKQTSVSFCVSQERKIAESLIFVLTEWARRGLDEARVGWVSHEQRDKIGGGGGREGKHTQNWTEKREI